MRPSHDRTIRSQSTPPAAPHNSLLRAGDRSVKTRDGSLVQSTPCPFRFRQAAKPSNHKERPSSPPPAHVLTPGCSRQSHCRSLTPVSTDWNHEVAFRDGQVRRRRWRGMETRYRLCCSNEPHSSLQDSPKLYSLSSILSLLLRAIVRPVSRDDNS